MKNMEKEQVNALQEISDFGQLQDKREWVGLTHDEIIALDPSNDVWGMYEIVKAAEAKLKEKNT